MDTKEKIAVMQAFVDGKEVQRYSNGTWCTLEQGHSPTWAWDRIEYRIKPKEPEVKYIVVYGKLAAALYNGCLEQNSAPESWIKAVLNPGVSFLSVTPGARIFKVEEVLED